MFDSLAIAAIADELRALTPARVQKATQPDKLSLGIELYAEHKRRWLYATADPERSGVWLRDENVGHLEAATTPLLQMARKWLVGGRMVSVDQPAFERVLRISFECPPARRLNLIVEATGRLGNVILVDETGLVMDALKRVPAAINRRRTILPKKPYVGPPPQEKATPLDLDPSTLGDATGAAAAALVAAVRGISPLAAREAVFRVCGDVDAPAASIEAEVLHTALRQIVGERRPSIAAGGFAPYFLTHLIDAEPTASLSDAVERFLGTRPARSRMEQARASLRAEIEAVKSREDQKVASLERELAAAATVEELRETGELLLAGITELHGRPIKLDPELTNVENARSYFERYRRARDASRKLPAMLAEAKGNVAAFEETLVHVGLAENAEVLASLRREALPSTSGRERERGNGPRPGSGARLSIAGHTVLVGRSARQNDEVLRQASPDDLWLHARGVHGSHVILKAKDEEAVKKAAALAAYYSQSRSESSVLVDVTERRNVKRIKGGGPGAVTYSGERTIRVAPTRVD